MSGVDKIEDAQARVGDLQDALTALQVGLERAEAVAKAAEEAKQRAEKAVIVTAALVAVTIIIVVVGRRQH